MDYVLFCRLPHFYISILQLDESRPTVVVDQDRVLDSNRHAAHRGIQAGMPLSQAKTILREDGVYRNLRAEEGREAQTEWLELASNFTGVIEPEQRHTAYLDLSSHPRPIDVAQRFLERLARLTGCEPVFGSGASKWLARLSADTNGERLLGLDEQSLRPLDTLCLTPVSIDQRERLRFLGYHSIGVVADLPMAILRSQFGDDALRILLAARGSWKDPVEALYPPDTLSEKLIFDGAISSTLQLDEALVSLGHRIGQRLAAKEQQASQAILSLELEEGEVKTCTRSFSKPLSGPRSSIAALRLLNREELRSPVISVGVRLPHLERARSSQQHLIGSVSRVEAQDSAESALKKVRVVFGEASIQVAGHIAQPRRIRVLQEWKNATGWR